VKPKDFGTIAEQLRRSTVQILNGNRGESGSGSGVIWNSGGLIVTNAHVMRHENARVELWDGRVFPATVHSRDNRRDLAALSIQTRGLPAAAPGDSSALRPGELVMAVGNPLGFVGALTTGVVHAIGPLRGLGRRPWVQAAVRLAPGNSGGPLADAQGSVVGLNTMVVAGGLALAIPSNSVADFLKRGAGVSLGVTVRPVNIRSNTIVGQAGVGQAGVGLMVLEIARNSPAETASLLPGDVLIAANNAAFSNVEDLSDAIDASAGRLLVLRFQRGGNAAREVAVQLNAPKTAAA
jgi:serine protease Do